MRNFRTYGLRAALASVLLVTAVAAHADDTIPRGASTPNTPKNWAGSGKKIVAQQMIDELIAKHPEIMSITMHGNPPGKTDTYTMFAGTFPDRIGNESSPGDIITIKKAVTQVEPKWGTPDWKQKVSVVLPLRDSAGTYLPAAMVIAFKTSLDDKRKDTDFLQPGLAIRDGLQPRIANFDALFAAAK